MPDLNDANHGLSKELVDASRHVLEGGAGENGQVRAGRLDGEGGAERPAAMKRVCAAEDVSRMSATDNRYRVIVENAGEVIVVVQDGLVKFANRKALELFGYMEREYAAVPVFEFIHPEDRERVRAYHSRRLAGETFPSRNAYRVIGSGGIIRWIEISSVMIDWDGRPATLNFITDITDRKRTEEALKESEKLFRLLAENATDVIWTMNFDGKFTYVSPSVTNLTGFTPAEVLQIPFDRYVVESYVEPVMAELAGELQKPPDERRRIAMFEIQHYRKDRSIVDVEITVGWLFDEQGNPVGVQGSTRDITDRKRMEARLQQGQKMEAIGALAGGIAHDFNNLLMGIAGYASLVKLDLKSGHRHYRMIEKIEEKVKSGSDLTRQLLGFACGGRYEVKPIRLNDLILRTSEIFGRTRKEISIRRKLQEDLWTVAVDPGQIEQMLMNLLINADQTMSGSGAISLETKNVDLQEEVIGDFTAKPGRYVKFSLNDTGTGMDEQTRTRVFEPFFTTRSTGKRTGLGLAAVYGIVKGHNGFVNVSSEAGHGTTFSIYLPASEKDVLLLPSPPDELVGGPERILLVDDEKDVREVGGALLEALGYGVFSASSGPEALALYLGKRQEIHLVILDMLMPGISGEETFAKLREVDPEVKVILSSGYSVDSRIRNIMERGCKGFLQKPYTMKELSRIVRSVLSNGLTPP